MFEFLLARLLEPSTYAGLAAVGAGADQVAKGSILPGLGVIAGGLAAVLVPEATAVPARAPQATK